MKYILFIVEGDSDFEFYAPIIHKLIGDKYRFKIVFTDMTSEISAKFKYKSGSDLVEYVIEHKNSRDLYNIDSIYKIVMIVDIDGCYINSRCIKGTNRKGTFYYDDYVETGDTVKLQYRNATKQMNLEKLKSCKYLFGDKPFELYYNCVNLDHVISNERNMSRYEKINNAEILGDYYAQNLESFVHVLEELLPKTDFIASWEYLKNSFNSLKRLSNFYFFIKEYIDKDGKEISDEDLKETHKKVLKMNNKI